MTSELAHRRLVKQKARSDAERAGIFNRANLERNESRYLRCSVKNAVSLSNGISSTRS